MTPPIRSIRRSAALAGALFLAGTGGVAAAPPEPDTIYVAPSFVSEAGGTLQWVSQTMGTVEGLTEVQGVFEGAGGNATTSLVEATLLAERRYLDSNVDVELRVPQTIRIAAGDYVGGSNQYDSEYAYKLHEPMILIGDGPAVTILRRDSAIPIQRVVDIRDILEGEVRLENLAISGGQAGNEDGGGIRCDADLIMRNCAVVDNTAARGGGIMLRGGESLVMEDCVVSGNTAEEAAGIRALGVLTMVRSTVSGNTSVTQSALPFAGTIAMEVMGTTTLVDCLITNNGSTDTAPDVFSASLDTSETLTIRNTTITGNTSSQSVLFLDLNGDAAGTIAHSTIAGNAMTHGTTGSIELLAPIRGSDRSSNDITLAHTIVSGNTADGGPPPETIDTTSADSPCVSGGFNLLGTIGTGSEFIAVAGDITDVDDPLLVVGPEGHLRPVSQSPAIDAGDPDFDPLADPELPADVRGRPRVLDGDGNGLAVIDIGAVEAAPLRLEKLSDAVEGPPEPAVLRIVRDGTTGDLDVTLAIGGASTAERDVDYTLASEVVTIPDGSSEVTFEFVPLEDAEPEAAETIVLFMVGSSDGIDPEASSAVITILDDDTVVTSVETLRHAVVNAGRTGVPVTFDENAVANPLDIGGAPVVVPGDAVIGGPPGGLTLTNSGDRVLVVDDGDPGVVSTVTVRDLEFTGSTGGAVLNREDLTVERCRLSGNSTPDDGGAIRNEGMLTVRDCLLDGNTSGGGAGGAIFSAHDLTVVNSTLSGNGAETDGGGIFSAPGAGFAVHNSTLTGNRAVTGTGGGLNGGSSSDESGGDVILRNSVVSGNFRGTGATADELAGVPANTPFANVAGQGTASQSSTGVFNTLVRSASFAVDGDPNATINQNYAETESSTEPWWQLDLGGMVEGRTLTIRSSDEGSNLGLLDDFKVLLSPVPFPSDELAASEAQPGVTTIHVPQPVGQDVSVPIEAQFQYLRIQLPGDDRILSLAEVGVFARGLPNLAPEGTATQWIPDFGTDATDATDGDLGTESTTQFGGGPRWQLDLGAPRYVSTVRFWFKKSNSSGPPLRELALYWSASPLGLVNDDPVPEDLGDDPAIGEFRFSGEEDALISAPIGESARYFAVVQREGLTRVILREFEVYSRARETRREFNVESGTPGTVVDPVLRDLGGRFPVHALVPNGPAVDGGDPAFDPAAFSPPLAEDVRGTGFPRVLHGRLDAGSFEAADGVLLLMVPDSVTREDADPEDAALVEVLRFFGDAGIDVELSVPLAGTNAEATDYTLAADGVTYPAAPGETATIPFPVGTTRLVVTVQALPDLLTEGPETIALELPDTAAYVVQDGFRSGAVTIPANGSLVSTVADSGPGSLRQVIENAAVLGEDPVVTFTDGAGGTVDFGEPQVIELSTPLPVTAAMDLAGPGLNLLTLKSAPGSGAALLEIDDGDGGIPIEVTLSDMTLTGDGGGGAVVNRENLFVAGCRFTGGTNTGPGGAVSNAGELTLWKCILDGNSSDSGGGALFNAAGGLAQVLDTTISGNAAQSGGGGIANALGATLNVFNSTIALNSAAAADAGGGIEGGAATLSNSLLAGNLAGGLPDEIAGAVTPVFSLIGDPGSAGGAVHGSNGTILGKAGPGGGRVYLPPEEAIALDLRDAGNGILVHVANPVPGSPILNAGDPNFDPLSFGTLLEVDASGGPRVQIGRVDIGAYEERPLTVTVTTVADENDGSADPALGSGTSLREAIAVANGRGLVPTIRFDPVRFGDPAVPRTIMLGHGPITVSRSMTIEGPGADQLTIDGRSNGDDLVDSGESRHFTVDDGNGGVVQDVTIRGLCLLGGMTATDGGSLLCNERLRVEKCCFLSNRSLIDGGAICVGPDGDLVIVGSTFAFNRAGLQGGGVCSAQGGRLEVVNSTISANLADFRGGGVYNELGDLLMVHCTVTGNRCDADDTGTGSGGGLFAFYGNEIIHNSIISGNFRRSGTRVDDLAQRGDIEATAATLVGGDPSLVLDLVLRDNGGPTPTHLPVAAGPAVDAADPALSLAGGAVLTTDQRGGERLFGAQVDAGAVEFGATPGDPGTGDPFVPPPLGPRELAPCDDEDRDGLANGWEEVLGTDPERANGLPIGVARAGAAMEVVLTMSDAHAPGEILISSSTNLVDWVPRTDVLVTTGPGPTGRQVVTFEIPHGGAERLFVRLGIACDP